MMPKKKILFIITGLSVGGAEMMLLKLLQQLERDVFSPVVISLTSCGEIGRKLLTMGIPVLSLDMKLGFKVFFKLYHLKCLVKSINPDIVHTWMYHADLIGGVCARFAGVNKILWSVRHSEISFKYNNKITMLLVRLCAVLSYIVPQKILFCSNTSLCNHVRIGYQRAKSFVIPNGFDLARFDINLSMRQSVRAELNLTPDVQLVGLIARDNPQKNHSGFISAAKQIHLVLPDVHFLLVGNNIDINNTRIVRQVVDAGLANRMHLLGRRDDIPRLMASLDILASSSIGEAFPNVLGEAMASGVPCVVTDVGDSADIVGETGRVVPAGDMSGLARNICELLSLPSVKRQALGAQARERVYQHYELKMIVQQYEGTYLALLR